MLFEQEVTHLHVACDLLRHIENKEPCQVLGSDGTFPEILRLESNIPYVRNVLQNSVQMTTNMENYQCVNTLPDNANFFRYQMALNHDLNSIESHMIIEDYIAQHGMDYRFETAPNPIELLRDRKTDNTTLGRVKGVSNACNLDI